MTRRHFQKMLLTHFQVTDCLYTDKYFTSFLLEILVLYPSENINAATLNVGVHNTVQSRARHPSRAWHILHTIWSKMSYKITVHSTSLSS
jgi:hypothetical protein